MGIRNPGPAYVGKYKTNKGGARWTNRDAAGWSSRCLGKGSAQKPQAFFFVIRGLFFGM